MKDNMRFVTKGFSGFNLLRADTHTNSCKGHSGAWLIVMLLVILMAGCNGNVSLESVPTVILTAPAADATGVATNTQITAAFSEEMDSATIDTSTFTLQQGATAITGTVALADDGITAVFTLNSDQNTNTSAIDLAANTTYTATITTGAKSKLGNALASAFVWNFTTGAAPDTTAPAVTLTSPADDATGVAVNTKIVAAFSDEMDPSTINNTTFTLKQGTADVPGTVSYSGSAVFTPATDLLNNTTYTATITTGAKDLAGNALASDFGWSFTTVAAGVLNVSPSTLTYANQTVGTTSAIQTVTISNTGGTALTVNSITNSNTADFIISAPLTPLTLNSGASRTFTVAFKPTTPEAKSATITVASDAGDATVSAIGTGVTAATLSVTPATLSYNDQAVGTTSATKTVTITNTGGTALTVFSISNNNTADFVLSAPATPLTLNGGASQTFTVAFKPSTAETKSATITIASTIGNATVSASGKGVTASAGVLSVSPTALTFDDRAVSTTSLPQTVTMINTGGTALTVSSIAPGGTNPGDFILALPSSMTINAGSTQTFTVAFKPTDLGTRSTTIAITSNGGNVTVAASGKGI